MTDTRGVGDLALDKWTILDAIGFDPHPGQLEVAESTARNRVVSAGRRWGKALAVDTPILTTQGWKTMADMVIGDQVFSWDGRPTGVVGVTEVMHDRDCYTVEFRGNKSITCDADHLWATSTRAERRHGVHSVKTAREMAGLPLVVGGDTNQTVEQTDPLVLPDADLPIDPYVLGVWLGDGSQSSAVFTINKDDLDIKERIESSGYTFTPGGKINDGAYHGRVACEREGDAVSMARPDSLVGELRSLGLIDNKHVPEIYLLGSIGQRLELLRGLMDSDGWAEKSGAPRFSSTNKSIAQGVRTLVASLGGRTLISEGTGKYKRDGQTIECLHSYRLHITIDVNPFNTPRKANRFNSRAEPRGLSEIRVTGVNPVDSVPVRCIQVANEDGMYLAGPDLIPTHNSFVGAHELVPEAFLAYTMRHELKASGRRREFWIVGPQYCADDQTEILTATGWRKQHELTGEEQVYTQNPETGEGEWQVLKSVNVFHSNHRYIYKASFRGFDMAVTGEHRWLTRWGKEGEYRKRGPRKGEPRFGWRWATTESLQSNDRIICSAKANNLPQKATISDAMVALVAWYWTEGSTRCKEDDKAYGHLTIANNINPNGPRIQKFLEQEFGLEFQGEHLGFDQDQVTWHARYSTHKQPFVCFTVAAGAAKQIRKWAPGKGKRVSWEFINRLTFDQLKIFITESLEAEARTGFQWGEAAGLHQKHEHNVDVLQMACSLAGVHAVKEKRVNKQDGTDCFTLSVYDMSKNNCIHAGNINKYMERQSHSGIVWCPTTPNGTWLARRNGKVYFTGNSDSEKEFRVLYNQLSALEVPFDRPGTYNDPIGGSLHISLWDGAFQVHGKSAQHPDQLVGEALSGAILAEAAKLKERIWTKYVRPTLADFGGWSLMTSTPEGKNWYYNLWQLGQDPRNTEWYSRRSPSWENPNVYKTPTLDSHVNRIFELSKLNQYAGWSFQEIKQANNLVIDNEIISLMGDISETSFNQEIAADFTEFVGRVFKDFDEEIHVKNLEFNPSWDTVAAVDYGFTNPNVWLLIQVSPWGDVNILREIYQPGLTAIEFADEIKRQGIGNVRTFFPDPASPGDTRILEDKLRVRATGGTGGELSNRIDAIREGLKPVARGVALDAPGNRPQILIDRSCEMTIFEFNEYRYPDEKRDGQNSTKSQENPMKKDDHTPEALGRFFKGYFGTPQQTSRGRRTSRAKFRRS